MIKFEKKIPKGFKKSISLPGSEDEARVWQEENRRWWNENPMRYDWNSKIKPEEFSKEFYQEIDSRFFSNAEEYFPADKKPFDFLIDFSSLVNKDVLEIGVGSGSHAQLLAENAKSFIGIDITDYAVNSAKKRFEIFNLPGKIIKMDAETLDFKDNSFDFVWSWGVIHHSSNTEKILKEIKRVLRPGGEAVIMVYHKGWWNYYFMGIVKGVISGELFKTKSLHKTVQFFTDGAIARYYTISGWRFLMRNILKLNYAAVFGPNSDALRLPRSVPHAIAGFFTHNLRMGSFLVSRLKKV